VAEGPRGRPDVVAGLGQNRGTEMKSVAVHSAAISLLMAGAAAAADMPVKAPPRAVAAAVYSWTGFYAGIHGGYGWGDADYNFPGSIPAGFGGFNGIYSPNATGGTFSRRISGGVFGGHAGYNQQYGNIVVGLEASASWSGLKGTAVDPFGAALGTGRTYQTKLDWFATLTPRLGIASNNWLFYAKAGLAAGQVVSDLTSTQVAVPILFHERNGHVGWTAGAGVEHAFTPNWIVGLEYNYVDLGTEQYGGGATQNGALAARGQYNVDLTYHTVLARLSYKADAPAAAAAVSRMPTKAAPVIVAAAGPWSGFYAGAHGGYGWGDADYASPVFENFGVFFPAGGAGFSQRIKGGIAGGHLGANYQTGNWLIGIEGAFSWSGLKGSSRDVFAALAATIDTYDTKLEWLATATPRLGYVSGSWLFYGKGGLAVGRAESRMASIGGQTFTFQEKTEHVGWTAGAGVEHAFTPNWIFGVEYNYVDLGKEQYGGHSQLAGVNAAGPHYYVDLKFSTVLARLSYKFGPAPVVARY
jgi:outer membrane immunogenic protein